MAHPFSSFLETPKTIAFWLLFVSLLPVLLPCFVFLSSFLLLLFFPLAFAFLFLALFHKFFSSLPRFLPLSISLRQLVAPCPHRPLAHPAPLLQPAQSPQGVLDGPGPTLPALEASDGSFLSRNDQCASLDEAPLPDRRKSTEAMLAPCTAPVSEVEIATGIRSTISSSSSEADEQKQTERGTSKVDEEDVVFQDSSEELSPCELEPSAPVESASQETTDTKEVGAVSNTPTLQGTEHHLHVSHIEDSLGSRREELPGLSAEEVSGDFETTSVHPEWKDESTSHCQLEGMPRTEVLHSDNEQASELRHEIAEDIADVPQPIDIEPPDLSVREPMDGFKPIVGEDEASSEAGLGFAADSFSAYEIACPACPHDAPEMFEEQECNRHTAGEDMYPYTGVGAAESGIKSSEDEKSRATCASSSNIGGVSESGIESLEVRDKEDDSEAEICSRATPVLESTNEPTEDRPIMVTSSKETNMLADIDAIKKIVGYQGDLHGCIVEQIRALYVFVGMEPSSSIVNTDDLEKALEELELLKVVIGVE